MKSAKHETTPHQPRPQASDLLERVKHGKVGIHGIGILDHEREVAVDDGAEAQGSQLRAAGHDDTLAVALCGGNGGILVALRACRVHEAMMQWACGLHVRGMQAPRREK